MGQGYEKLQRCCESCRNRIPFAPKLALILGSGLGDYAENFPIEGEIPYQEAYGDVLYTCVPARVIKTSVPDPELRRRVLAMYRAGKADYPYSWKGDTLAHKLWSTITYFHQIEKFKRYVGDVRREKAH